MREKHKIKKTFKYTFISFLFEVGIIATFVFLFAGSISYKIINNDIDTVPYLKINGESYEINNNSCKLTTNCFNLEVKKGDKIIDLGASPGGFSQVAAELCGSDILFSGKVLTIENKFVLSFVKK